ncbi:Uncharacterised protein [Amycolatopsis camponoti]|uniref:Uncharacterized protein n=1 Tax=Amycolatopsis camponoti TaxID=2606593 RepID=A0A6I8LW58_9PSEU|nr:Uncharacterised protein [Amycolatopsis camponoti]
MGFRAEPGIRLPGGTSGPGGLRTVLDPAVRPTRLVGGPTP